MSDLENWKSLTPRQRDALVAEAKGIRLFIASLGPERWHEVSDGPYFLSGAVEVQWDRFDESLLKYPSELAAYSTSWGYAGPLLEEMLSADCGVRFRDGHGGPTVVVCPCDASPIIAASEGEWPERIALAYLMWKGRRK